jgi:hypothetical protein
MVSILSAKTKLQISKTKDPIAREYTLKELIGLDIQLRSIVQILFSQLDRKLWQLFLLFVNLIT